MAGRRILYQKYGEKQIKMVHLATHPDYWRRGAGAMLCLYGMSRAKSKELAMDHACWPNGKATVPQIGV